MVACLRVLGLMAVLLFPACQTARLTAGDGVSGVYTLTGVGGAPVPGVVSHDGVQIQVRSGTLVIAPDGTCVSRTVFVAPDGRENTREVTARYERDGSRLTLQWTGAGTTVGEVRGATFLMDNHGTLFRYERPADAGGR